ncbi:MAG: hypothetical protein JOZ41_02610 [Chloroflexi bacterium]|nr:hypothetical protein [Chloroflexota bacterium]
MPIGKPTRTKKPKAPKIPRFNRGHHPKAANTPSPPGKPSRGKHPKHPKAPRHPKHPKAPKHPSTTKRGDLAHPVKGKHPGGTGGPAQSDLTDTTIGKPKHAPDTLAGMHLHSTAAPKKPPKHPSTHKSTKSFGKHKLGGISGKGEFFGPAHPKSAKGKHPSTKTGKAKKTPHTPSAVTHHRAGYVAPKVSHARRTSIPGSHASRTTGPFEESDVSTYFGVNSPNPSIGQPPSINPISSRLIG